MRGRPKGLSHSKAITYTSAAETMEMYKAQEAKIENIFDNDTVQTLDKKE